MDKEQETQEGFLEAEKTKTEETLSHLYIRDNFMNHLNFLLDVDIFQNTLWKIELLAGQTLHLPQR